MSVNSLNDCAHFSLSEGDKGAAAGTFTWIRSLPFTIPCARKKKKSQSSSSSSILRRPLRLTFEFKGFFTDLTREC